MTVTTIKDCVVGQYRRKKLVLTTYSGTLITFLTLGINQSHVRTKTRSHIRPMFFCFESGTSEYLRTR